MFKKTNVAHKTLFRNKKFMNDTIITKHNRIFAIKQSMLFELPPNLSKQQLVLLQAEPADSLGGVY